MSVSFQSPEKEVWETKKWNHDEVCNTGVKLIPLFRRRTIWDLAHTLNIPKSTLVQIKYDSDDTCRSVLKPAMTEQHKLLRVTFCLTIIDHVTRQYDNCMQSVHVDEKWFLFLKRYRVCTLLRARWCRQGRFRIRST